MHQNNRTILLVDDDDDDLLILQEAFDALGSSFHILEARNGVEALQCLNQLKQLDALPDLIVLDTNMPRMDGKQTLGAIKRDAHLSTVPVVALSTSSAAVDKQFFEAYGVAFITKPIGFPELLSVATRLLSLCKDHR